MNSNLPRPLTFWYPRSYHQNNNPFTLNILQAAEDDGAFCWLSTVFQTFSNFFFASEEDESGMLSLSEDTDDLDDLRGAVSGIVFTTSQFKYHFFLLLFFLFASLHPAGCISTFSLYPASFSSFFSPLLFYFFMGLQGFHFYWQEKE